MKERMYIFIGITDGVGAGRLCIATRTALSDRCHTVTGKQNANSPTIQYKQCSYSWRFSFCTVYVRLNTPPAQQRYNYPVSVDRPIRLSATLLCCQGKILKQQYCFMSELCVFWNVVLEKGGKFSWNENVRNEEVLIRVKEQRNIQHEIIKRQANSIDHILRRNCLLKRVIEGKIKELIVVTGRRGRRRTTPLDDLKERRGYCHLKRIYVTKLYQQLIIRVLDR